MSDETKAGEIKPALTRRGWEYIRANRSALPQIVADLVTGNETVYGEIATGDKPAQFAAAIALLNHGLPDGHPLKITREDVEAIEDEAKMVDADYGRSPSSASALFRIAAKLRALLPPAP